MKNIEVIKLILKEKPNEDVYTLFNNDDCYNLINLCILNKKYLNNEVLNQILNSKLIDKYLSYLLSNFPNLINKIPNNLLQNLSQFDWINILQKQPQLFNYCKNVRSFDVNSWINILKNQPKLANEYKKLYKNKNTLLYFILNSEEDLNVNFNELYNLNIDINKVSINNWLDMLKYNPDLIKICPIIDKINKSYNEYTKEVVELVSKQIKFKYLLSSVDKISNYHLSILISDKPQLIEELKINLKKFNKNNWEKILEKQPQLINECDKLKELTPYNWSYILSKQPKLIKYCDKINELNSYNWINILTDQPQLADKCNKFDRFSSFDWYALLKKQPQLIDKCKDINIINRRYKIDLLTMYSNLIDKIHLNKIDNNCVEILYNSREHHLKFMKSYIKYNKNSKVLTDMINLYPDLKDLYTKNNLWKYVDFNQLTDNIEYRILK